MFRQGGAGKQSEEKAHPGLGCGNCKHRGDSHVLGRKRPSVSSLERRNCQASRGFGAAVVSSPKSLSHMSFSHPRWPLPRCWRAEAPLVPGGQYLQATVPRKKGHLDPRILPQTLWGSFTQQTASRELCPSPALTVWVTSIPSVSPSGFFEKQVIAA